MKKSLVLFCLLALVLSLGCSQHHSGNSFDIGNVPDSTMQLMASDSASLIMADYPPGFTSIQIVPVASKLGSGFIPVLENALRTKGFTVVARGESSTLSLLYKVDSLKNDGVWYLNLQFAGRSIARVYNNAGAEGLLSQTAIPENRSFAATAKDKASSGAGHFKDGMNEVSNSITGSDLLD